jgi:hypothetical protein
MNGSGHRLLGLVVWRGGKWYLRHRYGRLIPSRRTVTVAALTAGGVGVAVLAGRRLASS